MQELEYKLLEVATLDNSGCEFVQAVLLAIVELDAILLFDFGIAGVCSIAM